MISSKLRIERWGNDYHGVATVSGSSYVIENPDGGRTFTTIQGVVDAAHARFPIAQFQMDFQVMETTTSFERGLLNALIFYVFAYLLLASIFRWWPIP